MAIINKLPAALLKGMTLLILVPLLSLLPPKDPAQIQYATWKRADDLQAYADHLADLLDASPAWFVEKADSLAALFWRTPRSADERQSYYFLLTGIGYAALQTGQVPVSVKWYEHALQQYRSEKDPAVKKEMEFEEYVCKPLGNNYTRVGDFTKAILVQQEAIQSAIDNGNPEPLPGLYSNIASTFFWMQEYDSAQLYIDKGLAVSTGTDPVKLLLQNLKTECFVEQGFQDSAFSWNDRALKAASQFIATHAGWVANAYADKADLLQQGKQYNAAAGWLLKARNMQQQASARDKAKLANKLGLLYNQSGRPGIALQWFDISLQQFNIHPGSLYPDFTVTEAMFGRAAALQATDTVTAANVYEQAVLNDYYTQQLISSSLNSRSSLYHNEVQTEAAIALHHHLFKKTSDPAYLVKALWLTELSKGRKLLYEQQRTRQWRSEDLVDENKTLFDNLKSNYLLLAQTGNNDEKATIQKRIDALEYTLNLKEDRFSKQLQAPSFDAFAAWLKEASAAKTIVSYFTGEQHAFIIIMQQQQLKHAIISDSIYSKVTDKTKHFIQDYFYKNHDAYNNDPSGYEALSSSLLQTWLPGWARFQNELIISPDGILHQLPFEALAQGTSFLGDAKAITYQYSLLDNPGKTAMDLHPEAIGSFSFEKAHAGFPSLPFAAEEKTFLSDHFKTIVHKADTTTMTTLVHALNTGDLLQLSTHAVAPPDDSQPYLVLKDKIYLGQLQYLTTKCPLMVLAACETGTGTLQKGEGLQSLGRSFIGKGVQGVLSSRWEMDDAATAQLIQLFYKNLAKLKHPSKALQAARQQYLQTAGNAAAKNPWLWAGLYYQGNDLAIVLPVIAKHHWWWIAAIVVLLVTGCRLRASRLKFNV